MWKWMIRRFKLKRRFSKLLRRLMEGISSCNWVRIWKFLYLNRLFILQIIEGGGISIVTLIKNTLRTKLAKILIQRQQIGPKSSRRFQPKIGCFRIKTGQITYITQWITIRETLTPHFLLEILINNHIRITSSHRFLVKQTSTKRM